MGKAQSSDGSYIFFGFDRQAINFKVMRTRQDIYRVLMTGMLLCLPVIASAQQQTGAPTSQPPAPAPSGNTQQGTPPSSSSGAGVAPSGNQPQGDAPAPGSNARPVTPAGQIEQSVQPTTQAEQQGRGTQPQPVTQPSTPQPGAPSVNIPTSDSLPSSGGSLPVAPASNIQPGQTIVPGQTITAPLPARTPGRESVASPAPQELLPDVPAIAPDYQAPQRPLPEMARVGVDLADQKPLSLREALEMALVNNKDIEVARSNVKIAEFDLKDAWHLRSAPDLALLLRAQRDARFQLPERRRRKCRRHPVGFYRHVSL